MKGCTGMGAEQGLRGESSELGGIKEVYNIISCVEAR